MKAWWVAKKVDLDKHDSEMVMNEQINIYKAISDEQK